MTIREDFTTLDTNQFHIQTTRELPVRGKLGARRTPPSKMLVVIEPARWAIGDERVTVDPVLFSKLTALTGIDFSLGLTAKEAVAVAQELRETIDVLTAIVELADEGRGLASRKTKIENQRVTGDQ